MNFSKWLSIVESASRPAYQTGLYPAAYGGQEAYPASYWIPGAADAIYYLTLKNNKKQKIDKSPK